MSELPSDIVGNDAAQAKAPDPRRHYDSPEDLREDVALDLATREELLREWKQEIDRQLESEAEGMGVSDPLSAERESKLSGESRRVTTALAEVVEQRGHADSDPAG